MDNETKKMFEMLMKKLDTINGRQDEIFSVVKAIEYSNNTHKACFVHGGKAVEAVIYLIFIVSNIMQLLLVRRLKNNFKNQREIVRLLLKGLYLLKYKYELVFNSV